MGGYVALRAIERSPERFRALVLCDTRAEADSNEAKLKRAAGMRSVKNGDVAGFTEKFLVSVFAQESFVNRPEAVESIRQIIRKNPPAGLCGGLLAMASRTDTTAVLPKIRVPTLILVGEKDAITPPETAQSMQKQIPGSQIFLIPQAGHMSNLENPTAFNRRLNDFLSTL